MTNNLNCVILKLNLKGDGGVKMAVAEKKSFAQSCKIFYAKIKKGYEKLDGAKPVVAWLVLIGVATACLLLCLLPFLFKDGNTVWT